MNATPPDRPIVTRFAPSPTGFLHIGGARTALFNWLYAKHTGGTFKLRIEDTDRARSTQEAIDAILEGLTWLGLDWDGEPIYQSTRADRHREAVENLLAKGHAYRCYTSADELTQMREQARAEGRQPRYDGRWRDRDPAEAPAGVDPVIRLKAPQTGKTIIDDAVQGPVTFANETLDDMVLLRSDGSPTYMLAVVVDDNDMGVTHAIRGDDHLNNAARQSQIYQAFGWDTPIFAHIPLIHGSDGAKLSKRHGALGVEAYRDMGFLPEALINYLARLGWSHGDDEIFSIAQAADWFDLPGINKAPARLDLVKLENVNSSYMKNADSARLVELTLDALVAKNSAPADPAVFRAQIGPSMPELQQRAKTVKDLVENIAFLNDKRPVELTSKAQKALSEDAKNTLKDLANHLEGVTEWTAAILEDKLTTFCDDNNLKMGKVAQPLRAALTGGAPSFGIYGVMAALGREETLARIHDQV